MSAAPSEEAAPDGFARGTEEFNRALTFSDGIFAIAMTLLVVGIAVPSINDASSVSDLADALNDQSEAFVSFFISFAVIGRYWYAHHQFVALLDRVDGRLIGINLLYLAFIAFLPFPTDLLGTYFDNPLSVAIYAVAVAVISGLEVVMLRHAHRNHLMLKPMPEPAFRWGATIALSPVFVFLLSVPVAFASTTAAVLVWFAGIPFQVVYERFKPPEYDEYFGA